MASNLRRPSNDISTTRIIDVVTVEPMESETLRVHSQHFIDRMYNDSSNVANVSPFDVIGLLAIFQRNRNATLSHEPRLLIFAKTFIINKLLTRAPFHHFDDDILIHLRRYIMLLAEVLRSFRDEEKLITIEHVTRGVWYYEGINKLSDTVERAGRDRPQDLEIEWWDSKITLKHCQYLLLSMNDSYNKRDHLFERSGLVIKGALQGYANQYADVKATLDSILKGQRNKEPWHERYLELESIYFEVFHHSTGETLTRTQRETSTIIDLRNGLEGELLKKAIRTSSAIKKGVHKILREIGRQIQAKGPYEEHDYYFEYLVLDLMYRASFTLKNRLDCFGEIIGAVQNVLLWSHECAAPLHRKATDLYYRIAKLAKEDKADYIKEDRRRIIEQWVDRHPNNYEKNASSER